MMTLTPEQKLKLANLVRDNKEVLFGKYSPIITKVAKNKAWENIYQEMIAVGAAIKNASHLRKPTWDNLRRRTLEKVQKSNKTGEGGSELSELDEIILDIVNADASFLTGLGQSDEMQSFITQDTEIVETIEDSDLQTVDNNDPSANGEGSTSVPSQTEPQPTGSKTKTITGKKKKASSENLWSDDEYKVLKKKKLQAALEEQQIRMQLMKEQCLLFRAQTRLAYEQTQLVALQAENLRKQSEIFTFQVPDRASVENVLFN